ncbi:MAG: phage major capsid domain-containing protein, partial [Candidatus Fonsibacter sp.]
MCREVLWQTTVTLRTSNPDKAVADFAVNYGVTDALAPFPLHSLVSVMSCTINDNTANLNVQDSLPLLLRMVDPEEFSKYDSNGSCPVAPHAHDHGNLSEWQCAVG